MKYLLLLTLFIGCKQNQPSNCNYQLPKDYCLYYNSNTKEYIVGFEKHDTTKARYLLPGIYITTNAGNEPNMYTGRDTTIIYSFSQYWGIYKGADKAWWVDDKKCAVRFSDSCIAKGTVEQNFKQQAIQDSISKAKAKAADLEAFKHNHQDSLNNAFQPINCIK